MLNPIVTGVPDGFSTFIYAAVQNRGIKQWDELLGKYSRLWKGVAMLIKHRGFEPQIDSSLFVAPNATFVGKIHIGPNSRVMFGAVIDSEGSEIEIGEYSIICENAVIRATASGDVDHPEF